MTPARALPLLITAILSTTSAHAEVRVLSWNLESNGADAEIIGRQLRDLGGYELYCFQEVLIREAGRHAFAIREAFGQNYRYITTNTGQDDRLMIVYDTSRFDLVESRELFRYGGYELNAWRHRSPLVLVLRDKPSGRVFNLMTVHLARGDRRFRREQAAGLREWAAAQSTPTIAIGDFNFDYDIPTGRGNPAFDTFLEKGVWTWVKPNPLVDTNYDDRDEDGLDNYPDSCLDFAFTSGDSFASASSRVIVRDGDFPDDNRTPDHRPIELTFSLE
ncbi:MAG: endonuclease/exonuclease/phosphatase family protein [Planctomycetota bacterium]